MEHIPVLAKEVIEGLALQPGMTVIDATVGLGGHARLMLEKIGATGKLIAFDRDPRNLFAAKEHLDPFNRQTTYIQDSFAQMGNHQLPPVNAILFDLGYSSVHVDDPERGFSFLHDGPLDMRYDPSQELTAAMIVNQVSKDELSRIIRQFGEEPMAYRIADAIFTARRKEKFTRTTQLADLIEKTVRHRGKTHPATRTFQALRIVVNDEFGEIEKGLSAASDLLVPGGRLAVLSFHSLEDRVVKQHLKTDVSYEPVTKKPIVATREEEKENPRSRSAKLRIVQKL